MRLLRIVQWGAFAVFLASWVGLWALQGGGQGTPLGTALASVSRLVGSAPAEADVPRSTAESRPDRRAQAPDFTLQTFDGGSLRLADLRGQAVVLNFWASWCVPCREEAPVLVRAAQANRDRGVVFVGINVQDIEADARAFLAEFGIIYPNGPDRDSRIATDFGVVGIPTTLFLDAEGRLARRWIGVLTEPQLNGFVEEVRP